MSQHLASAGADRAIVAALLAQDDAGERDNLVQALIEAAAYEHWWEAFDARRTAQDAEFKEDDHPRSDDGKFTSGGGGGGAAKKVGSETFGKKGKKPPASLGGVPFTSWQPYTTDQGWEDAAKAGPKFDEPKPAKLPSWTDAHGKTQEKKRGAGVIIEEPDGRIWIMHPTNAFGGYKATFPKGHVEPGMTSRATAIKEAYEETGLRVELTGYAGDVERDGQMARYYFAKRIGGTPEDHGWEAERVSLAPPDELHQHLNRSYDRKMVEDILEIAPPPKVAVQGTDPSALTAIAQSPTELEALSASSHDIGKALTKMTPEATAAKAAISEWTNPAGYKKFNNYLNGKSGSDAPAGVTALQKAILSQSLPEAVNVYRGVHGPQLADLEGKQPGDTYTVKGFSATTIDPKRATHYAKGGKGGALIHMVLPQGSKALYVSNPKLNGWTDEHEMLLPHGSTFKYLGSTTVNLPQYGYTGKKTGEGGPVTVHQVELVPPSASMAQDAFDPNEKRAAKPAQDADSLASLLIRAFGNRQAADAEFKESQHPRDPSGKFGAAASKYKEHAAVNEWLRGDRSPAAGSAAENKALVRDMDAAIEATLTQAPMTLWRGYGDEDIQTKLGTSGRFLEPAYTSATKDPEIARALQGEGYLAKLSVPAGHPHYDYGDDDPQREVVLPRDTRWAMSDIDHDKRIVSMVPVGRRKHTAQDAFEESKHPRGQPENAGEFAKGQGSGGAAKAPAKPAARPATGRAAGMVPLDRSKPLPAHLAKLAIPPAWTDVRVATDPKAALLVTGRDTKGRPTAVYSEAHHAKQAAAKFARIAELTAKFDKIRAQNEQARQDPARRNVADALAVVMAMGIRPGSERDTGAEKQAYGATTLEGRHVHVEHGRVSLVFTGKKGVALNLPVDDPALAKMLVQRKQAAGETGKIFGGISNDDLLAHSHSMDGGGFRSKDFRTHLGTKLAANLVASMPPPTDAKSYRQAVITVGDKVSAKLGNTRVVAIQSYISPEVFSEWRSAAGV